ncbi:F-box protein At1g67340-like [Asparagus officinalis]|uniref:F-box protein At1g67340-like n=1 Tax=Asparagus officinalis TaxID=4686 RepID=UPI00098E1758|nr:F-box protein At1g67340-like [Asparagus officinalis]
MRVAIMLRFTSPPPPLLSTPELCEPQNPTRNREPHPKRQKFVGKDPPSNLDLFDALPDDLIVSVLSRLSSSAGSPSDLVSALVTCKRLNALGSNASVLSKASRECLVMRAKNWSESGDRFLKRCSDSGNLEASFTLGMIRFYCSEMRLSGLSLMARAALGKLGSGC